MKTKKKIKLVLAWFIILTYLNTPALLSGSSLADQTMVSRHDFIMTQPATEPLLGLLLGNGDLGASVWADGETLVFTLGKNDVWDRRYNTSHDRPTATCDELIQKVTNGTWDFGNYYCSQPIEKNYSPTPKPVGQIRFTGLGAISNLHLRLRDATLTFDTHLGQGIVFIEYERNVVFIRLPAEAAAGLRAEVFRPREKLDWTKPPPPPAQFMSTPTPENGSDPFNAPLVPPETGITGESFWTLQRIPAEPTFPNGFAVATAATLAGAEGKFSLETDGAVCKIRATQSPWVTLAVAVRTTGDGDPAPVASAYQLANAAAHDDWETIHSRHAGQWQRFWSRSSIEINAADEKDEASAQDAALAEGLFYRNLYLLACCSRPGAVAPGLLGNWIWSDLAPWHGIYMLNYNFEQEFWPAFICNHAELVQPYFDRFCQTFPNALAYSKFAYGPDTPGACFTSGDYPIRRDRLMLASFVYDLTMEVSAWVMQHFWRHWQYTGDREFLEQHTYPMLVDVARFYDWFLHRSQREDCTPYVPRDGRLHIFPTFSPEHWGIVTRNFERNRDSASAIAFIRYHLLATAEAADILQRDSEEAARWRQLARQLPDYPTFETPEGKIFVDVPGAPPIEYNIPVPLVPVFPAEDPTFWANSEQVEMARRTARVIQTNGTNSMVTLGVARARLGLDDSLAQFLADVRRRLYPNGVIELALAEKIPAFMKGGVYTENFAAAGVIAEHLLQSHPDATGKPLLRLFPVLPATLDGRFAGLVGEGAFEVAAERKKGMVTEVQLFSRRGALCRILNPWKDGSVTLIAGDKKLAALSGEVLEFSTQAGTTYCLAMSKE